MEFNELIKSALRVKTDDAGINEEIKALISSAKDDLKTAGVNPKLADDESNVLVKQAIIFYCKSAFGYDNPDAARFNNMYQSLKNTLTETGDVNEI